MERKKKCALGMTWGFFFPLTPTSKLPNSLAGAVKKSHIQLLQPPFSTCCCLLAADAGGFPCSIKTQKHTKQRLMCTSRGSAANSRC